MICTCCLRAQAQAQVTIRTIHPEYGASTQRVCHGCASMIVDGHQAHVIVEEGE